MKNIMFTGLFSISVYGGAKPIKSINVHLDFLKQIKKHSDEEIGRFFRAMAADIDGSEAPELPLTLAMLKELIDEQNTRFEENKKEYSEKQSERGKKGGAPSGNQNAKKQAETTESTALFENNPNQPKQANQPKTTETTQTTEINQNNPSISITNTNTINNKNTLSGASRADDVRAVVDYLNQRLGTAYKPNSKTTATHIIARLNEGFKLDDFIAVIDKKVLEWKNRPDMAQYLRPQTLFGTKFESYLNQPCTDGNKRNDPVSNAGYVDLADLARQKCLKFGISEDAL